MTVKELIERLNQVKNKNLPVHIPDDNLCDCCNMGTSEANVVDEVDHTVYIKSVRL